MAQGVDRRAFLRLIAAATGSLLIACGRQPLPMGEHPGDAERPILGNENSPAIKPHWNVRFYRRFQALDHHAWRLTVDGLVERPLELDLTEVQALPAVTQVSRMVCVEGWSSKAEWVGFTYRTLAELVRPSASAQWVYFECGDGYYEYLSIAELGHPRVLFVYKMDGELLHDKFGAPLRLIVPPKYGYKGPKTITRLTFTDVGRAGYWPTVGPYTVEGAIQPGIDFPLDLQERRTIQGGEVTEY